MHKMMKKNVPNTARQSTTLLHLNADCLIAIFSKLPMNYKINLAFTCERLYNFYLEEIAPTHKIYTKEDVNDLSQLKLKDVKRFLAATAKHVVRLDLPDEYFAKEILHAFIRYGSVKEINMPKSFKYGKEFVCITIGLAHSVENLNIADCTLKDQNVADIGCMPNLRILNLNWNNGITGKSLATAVQLEELYLHYTSLETEFVQKIAKCCPKLRLLDVCSFLMDAETSKVVGRNCSKLESLRFRGRYADFKYLSKLPNLRKLSIFDGKISYLNTLAKYKAEQMEDIRILEKQEKSPSVEAIIPFKNLKVLCCQVGHGYSGRRVDNVHMLGTLKKLEKLVIVDSENLEDDALLAVLEGCTSLQYMAIMWCGTVSDAFLFGAIDLIKARRNALKKPFILVFYKTAIVDVVLQDVRCLEVSSFLTLHVLPPVDFMEFDFQYDFPQDV